MNKILRKYWQMIRRTSGDKLLAGLFVFYIIDSFVLWFSDPALSNYGDALWLGFNILTSIGLGDFTVTTPVARIAAVALGIYGAVVAAYVPGLVASYYMEQRQLQKEKLLALHQEELRSLSKLDDSQKKKLSQTIARERSMPGFALETGQTGQGRPDILTSSKAAESHGSAKSNDDAGSEHKERSV